VPSDHLAQRRQGDGSLFSGRPSAWQPF
jgi:hypothetical protein